MLPCWYGNDTAPSPELHATAEEDHRSAHQTVVRAIETYLAQRETAGIKADAGTLRALAEARESDVVHGTEAVRNLVAGRHAS